MRAAVLFLFVGVSLCGSFATAFIDVEDESKDTENVGSAPRGVVSSSVLAQLVGAGKRKRSVTEFDEDLDLGPPNAQRAVPDSILESLVKGRRRRAANPCTAFAQGLCNGVCNKNCGGRCEPNGDSYKCKCNC